MYIASFLRVDIEKVFLAMKLFTSNIFPACPDIQRHGDCFGDKYVVQLKALALANLKCVITIDS